MHANYVRLMVIAILVGSNLTAFGQDANFSSIADLRATSRMEAAQRFGVRVRGIVSLVGEGLASPTSTPALTSFCIEDESAGIWVNVSQAIREKIWLKPTDALLALHEGLEIELEGLLDPGAFAPVILPVGLKVLGEKPLPAARITSLERLMRGAEDVQRLRVSGVVQSIAEENEKRWLLRIETGLGHLLARLPKTEAFMPARLLDAEVELTGLVAVSRNWRAEFICPRMIVSHLEDVVIAKAPPIDPFASEKVPLCALDGFTVKGRPLHRRRIEGIVTYIEPDARLYLQDGRCAVRVESTSNSAVAIGDRVEAVGFIDNSYSVAGLGGAIIRRVSSAEALLPIPISMAEIDHEFELMRRGQLSRFPGYDGMLVSMTGRLLGVQGSPSPGGLHRLELDCDDSITTAFVNGPVRPLLPGAVVQVTGVAQLHYAAVVQTANFAKPIRIDLLLRNTSDIVVLKAPSWWTRQRMFWALVGLGAIAIVVMVWAVALRRTVASQTRKLAKAMQSRRDAAVEFQAALRERTRLAANLHDTVLQSMTGIAYQIEACESESLPVAQRGANHLATARRMVQRGQEDLRSAVWALRALPLNERTFAESVRSVAKQISAGHDVAVIVECTTSLPGLADFIAGNLLLIVQEAIHNAIKHARAKEIRISLAPLNNDKRVSLTVQDDGVGFVLGSQLGANAGHFGLEGMRERAERLSGSLTVHSEPGRGTRISCEVPVLDFDPYLA